jgi:carboxyl-terminal processing protease
MFFIHGVLYGASHAIQYRTLLNKIDCIEKGYVKKISKADLIGSAFSELLKDLPERDQKMFLINNLKWLSRYHPKTHQHFLKKTLKGVAKALDDHSSYLSPAHFKNMMQVGQGKMAGIGVELFEKNGMVEIVGIMPSSPAKNAGLKVGDLLTHINGEVIKPSKDYIVEKLRGEVGSSVSLVIQRNHRVFTVTLFRQMISVKALSTSVHKGVLYIQLNYFTNQTYFMMKKILKQHPFVKGCILDLRNNPGGVFQQGVLVSGLFLKKNKEILSMNMRHQLKKFYAFDKDYLFSKPLVVLVNRATASSAEIVAGCLKDTGRAILVGEGTLGKGTIQKVKGIFPSCLFGGFKYTVAEFFTASGNPIQNKGISPHFYISDSPVSDQHDKQLKKGFEVIYSKLASPTGIEPVSPP